jgi:hypothetical protein
MCATTYALSQSHADATSSPREVRESNSVDLSKYGFGAVTYLPNSALRYDAATILESSDPNTHLLFDSDKSLVVYRIVHAGGSDAVMILELDVTHPTSLKQARFTIASRRSRDELIDGEGIISTRQDGSMAVVADRTIHILTSSLQETSKCVIPDSYIGNSVISIQAYGSTSKLLLRATTLTSHISSFSLLDTNSCHIESAPISSQLPGSVWTVWSIGRYLVFRDGAGWTRISTSGNSVARESLFSGYQSVNQTIAAANSSSLAMNMNSSAKIKVWNMDDTTDYGIEMNMGVPATPPGAMNACSPGSAGLSDQGRVFASEFVCTRDTLPAKACGSRGRSFINIYDVYKHRVSECIPINLVNGDFSLSISPNGRHLAVFNGGKLQLYELE